MAVVDIRGVRKSFGSTEVLHGVARAAGEELLAVCRERHPFQPGQRITLRPQVAHGHLFDASGARVSGG